MNSVRALLVVGLSVGTTWAKPAQAQQLEIRSKSRPSVFLTGTYGLLAGAAVGLGGGYFAHQAGEPGTAYAMGAGIGALSGAALGLTLGITDLVLDKPGLGRAVTRDLALGALFGCGTGAIAGSLTLLDGHGNGRVVADATVVGGMIGVGLGLGVGILQYAIDNDSNASGVGIAVVPVGTGASESGWGLSLSGAF